MLVINQSQVRYFTRFENESCQDEGVTEGLDDEASLKVIVFVSTDEERMRAQGRHMVCEELCVERISRMGCE
jgi:hypothetical protein